MVAGGCDLVVGDRFAGSRWGSCSFPRSPPAPRRHVAALNVYLAVTCRDSLSTVGNAVAGASGRRSGEGSLSERPGPGVHGEAGSGSGLLTRPASGDPGSPSSRPSARHVETCGQPNGGVWRPSPNESGTAGSGDPRRTKAKAFLQGSLLDCDALCKTVRKSPV